MNIIFLVYVKVDSIGTIFKHIYYENGNTDKANFNKNPPLTLGLKWKEHTNKQVYYRLCAIPKPSKCGIIWKQID